MIQIAARAGNAALGIDVGDGKGQIRVFHPAVVHTNVDFESGHLFGHCIVGAFYHTIQGKFAVDFNLLVAFQIGARDDRKQIAEIVFGCVEGQIHAHVVFIGQLYPTICLQTQGIDQQVVVFQGVFTLVLVNLKNSIQYSFGIAEVAHTFISYRQ